MALCLWPLVLSYLSHRVLTWFTLPMFPRRLPIYQTLSSPEQDLHLQVPTRSLQWESCALRQLDRAAQTANPLTLIWTRGIKCPEFVPSKYLISSSQPCLGISFGLLVSETQKQVMVGTCQETQGQAQPSIACSQLGKALAKINTCKGDTHEEDNAQTV